jgi:Uma2 family endonuclease
MDTLAPATVKLTIAEFEAFVESQPEGYPYYELHDGDMIEMPVPSDLHADIASLLIQLIGFYLHSQPIGKVLFEREVKPLRAANYYIVDVGFYAFAHFPEGKPGGDKRSPTLAIEIYSPSNTYGELENKALDYLESGSRLVWIVYPNRQQVHVYHPDQRVVRVLPDGVLDGGEVLPGFTINMAEFWAKIK